MIDNSYVTVDLDALRANFRAIAQKAGTPVMAVIKADAYGHGAVVLAKALQEAAAFFGVSCMREALELRRAGVQTPILVLGPVPQDGFETAIAKDIRVPISCLDDALLLSETACRMGKTARFHLALDTGMSRIGLQAQEVDMAEKICRLPGLYAEGLFSHFATADSADLTAARAQTEAFSAFDAALRVRGVEIPLRSMSNSAGIMNFDRHFELVRAGIVLYGLYPSPDVDPARLPLQPVLRWDARITHLKTLEKGRAVSYGGTYVTRRPTVVATVPVGYADGYKRGLSGKFHVLIHGQPAPILGRVCMDQLMVDVTEIPGVQAGDRVTLIGRDGDACITVEEIAAAAGSFNYEFVCGIGRRVPRYYRQNGQIVQRVRYLED